MLTIEQPKIVRSMIAGLYHANGALSASKLKAMRKSPAHCRYQLDHPKTTDAMVLGSLLHAMVLERETVHDQFAAIPECDRRTKEGKAIYADAMAASAGKTMVRSEDWEIARAMRQACSEHPAFNSLFGGNGNNELSVFWTDEVTGLPCKLRADRVVELPGFGMVCVDLKTTADASADAFAKTVNKFGYHLQAAFYLEGLALAGMPCEHFVMMAVESEPPHCVAVYALDDDAMEQGRKDCRQLKWNYAACVKSGVWPAYPAKIQKLSLPRWAFENIENT